MKCCICGKEINDYGNNPFPLCDTNDRVSRCCNKCNDLVVKARLAQTLSKNYNNITIDSFIPQKTNIAILWSKNSNVPIETLLNTERILIGQVITVDKQNNLLYGNWGAFAVNVKTDNYFIIKDSI